MFAVSVIEASSVIFGKINYYIIIIIIIDDWLEQINDNSLTGACLLDVSKCFDSINHDILLKKVRNVRDSW